MAFIVRDEAAVETEAVIAAVVKVVALMTTETLVADINAASGELQAALRRLAIANDIVGYDPAGGPRPRLWWWH